jgi:maltooligosyltrehalose trehalohydrolase
VSALLLLTPYTPLLWMGQEWAATTPFLYFTDHPEELGRLVTDGRRDEFRKFARFSDPAMREKIPDPQAEETFSRSRLDWSEAERAPHRGVLALYRELLRMRRLHPALQQRDRGDWSVGHRGDSTLVLRRGGGKSALILVVNVAGTVEVDIGASGARLLLHTGEARFDGGGDDRVVLSGDRVRFSGPAAALLEAGGA